MGSDRRRRLGEILGAKGYVTEAKISQLLSRAQNAGKMIGEILIEEGYITEEVLASALEEQRKEQLDR
jgi:mannitol/fructose-specific phosphotransferase system IIA component